MSAQLRYRIRDSRELGRFIAAARRRKRLSQRQVAESLGVTQAWISRVERGKQRAWVGQVLHLASFVGVELWGALPEDSDKPARTHSEGRPG